MNGALGLSALKKVWEDDTTSTNYEWTEAFNNGNGFVASRAFDAGMDVYLDLSKSGPEWSFLPPQPNAGYAVDFVVATSLKSTTIVGASAYEDFVEGANTTLKLWKWTSPKSVADWEFVAGHDIEIAASGGLAVSDDGTYIVLLVSTEPSNKTQQTSTFYLFKSTSNKPVVQLPISGQSLSVSFATSDLIYIITTTKNIVFSIQQNSVVWTGSFDTTGYLLGTCIANSVQYILVGETDCSCSNTLLKFDSTSKKFVQVFSTSPTSSRWVAGVALSADCSTLAIGLNDWTYLSNSITVYNPLQNKQLFSFSFPNATRNDGQDVLSSIAVANDGSLISVGLWGDESNDVPQLWAFSRSGTALSMTYQGSVFTTYIFYSGGIQFIIVGSKTNHANQWGNGVLSLVQVIP